MAKYIDIPATPCDTGAMNRYVREAEIYTERMSRSWAERNFYRILAALAAVLIAVGYWCLK